jgi:hypothetical protein
VIGSFRICLVSCGYRSAMAKSVWNARWVVRKQRTDRKRKEIREAMVMEAYGVLPSINVSWAIALEYAHMNNGTVVTRKGSEHGQGGRSESKLSAAQIVYRNTDIGETRSVTALRIS